MAALVERGPVARPGPPAAPEPGRRVMVVWCPDWPVVAAALQHELSLDAPVAVVERGEVFACSTAARAEGVKRGMRRRDASARCPELVVVDRVPEVETRSFDAVLAAVEEVSAGVAPMKPGLCALPVPTPVLRRRSRRCRRGRRAPGRARRLGLPDGRRRRHLRRRAGGAPGRHPGLHRGAGRRFARRSWPRCRSGCSRTPSWSACSDGWGCGRSATSPPCRRGT